MSEPQRPSTGDLIEWALGACSGPCCAHRRAAIADRLEQAERDKADYLRSEAQWLDKEEQRILAEARAERLQEQVKSCNVVAHQLRQRADELEARAERLARERDDARIGLEADAADLWRVTNAIRKAIQQRAWVTEARGSYEWDDDRYRDETRHAFDEVTTLINGVQNPAQQRFHEIMRGIPSHYGAQREALQHAEQAEQQLHEKLADVESARQSIQKAATALAVNRDEWKQRAEQAEARAERLEAELRGVERALDEYLSYSPSRRDDKALGAVETARQAARAELAGHAE